MYTLISDTWHFLYPHTPIPVTWYEWFELAIWIGFMAFLYRMCFRPDGAVSIESPAHAHIVWQREGGICNSKGQIVMSQEVTAKVLWDPSPSANVEFYEVELYKGDAAVDRARVEAEAPRVFESQHPFVEGDVVYATVVAASGFRKSAPVRSPSTTIPNLDPVEAPAAATLAFELVTE